MAPTVDKTPAQSCYCLQLFFYFSFVCATCVCTRGGQRTSRGSCLSFHVSPEITLRSSGVQGKCLFFMRHPWGHFSEETPDAEGQNKLSKDTQYLPYRQDRSSRAQSKVHDYTARKWSPGLVSTKMCSVSAKPNSKQQWQHRNSTGHCLVLRPRL